MKTDYDRMFVYLWEEVDALGQCKFGEHWVKANTDPEKECQKRIRDSLNVRKHLYDDGKINIIGIWDVTTIAKNVDRYRKQSRVDDYLREQIGYRHGSTGDVHDLPGIEMKIKINTLLTKLEQPLIPVELSTKQYEVADEVIDRFNSGDKVILAELCARFGKTIWSSAVGVELEADNIIIASYIKTVFTSFASDITSFNQFSDYVHIDTGSKDYKKQYTQAKKKGKKVFLYLSLCNGSKRQERINWLANLKGSKLLVVDEADFGAHREKQAIPLINKLNKIDYTIIMTGTNADRAATYWPIDYITSVTYPELLMQKRSVRCP
jgi:hypothetical protein